MARRYRKGSNGTSSGDAAKDGYTCYSYRPRTALPGTFMSEAEAEDYDAVSEMIGDFGSHGAVLRRRIRTEVEDGDDWFDWPFSP